MNQVKFYLWVFVYFGAAPATVCVALGGNHWDELLAGWALVLCYFGLFFMAFDIRRDR